MEHKASSLMSVVDSGRALGVSPSTIWRLIRRGALPSVRLGGRRLVPRSALQSRIVAGPQGGVPPLGRDNPIFRLVGAGRSGGHGRGARDKHAILDR